MADAELFLRALWSEKPDGTAVQLWRKSDQKTFTFAAIDPAIDWVGGNTECDVYMAAGLAAKAATPSKQRATKRTVVGIAGVWADIDVNGGPERKTGAARDRSEALSLAESVIRPTIIVDSGYGIQAWWLFEDGAWAFHTEAERDQAALVVTGFHGALKAEAKRRGYTIDSTFDLARLMRIPGSYNHKGSSPAGVSLLDDGGPRYSRAHIEEIGADYQNQRASALQMVTGEAIEIAIVDNAQPPLMKLQALLEIDDDFAAHWNHKLTTKSRGWSMSEYEFSFVNAFVSAGWSDQEVCDALVFHRLYYEPGDPKSKNRVERIASTIGKVRATRQHEQRVAHEEADREQAVEQLAAIAGEGGLDPVVTIGLFNRILGGPEVKELVQFGKDPDTTRYTLQLASGDSVPLTPDEFFNLERFRNRFAIVTRYRPKRVKVEKWDEVVQALLSAAEVRDDFEDTREHRALEWISSYVERRVSTDRDAACQNYDPFLAHEDLYLPLGPFHQWLRKIRGERIDTPDLRQYLESAGFERKNVNYLKADGKRSTRSYFVGARHVL